MTDDPRVNDDSPGGDDPTIRGSPNRPAFVKRRGLFLTLLVIYVVWMGALIAMSIQLHQR